MLTLSRRKFMGSAAIAAGAGLTLESTDSAAEDLRSIGRTPHTKFSINIEMWWKELPWPERIRKTAELGFPAVEFWGTENKDLEAIQQACTETGIVISNMSAGLGGLNDPSKHAGLEERAEQGCAIGVKMGASCLLATGGNVVPGMTKTEMHDHIIAALTRAAPIFEKHRRILILEPLNTRVNHPNNCLSYSDDALRICRTVNSPAVKIDWDLYHFHIMEGDLTGHLKDGWDQVGYIQLADHPGRNEPGTGEIHYPFVLKTIYELGYRGYIGAECKPSGDHVLAARRLAAADQW